MAKTITTQYGEFLNYDNLVRIGVVTNWEDAEPDENGIVKPDYEMVGTDTSGNQIPRGNYKTPEAAESALADLLHNWLSAEAYAVYEVKSGGDA